MMVAMQSSGLESLFMFGCESCFIDILQTLYGLRSWGWSSFKCRAQLTVKYIFLLLVPWHGKFGMLTFQHFMSTSCLKCFWECMTVQTNKYLQLPLLFSSRNSWQHHHDLQQQPKRKHKKTHKKTKCFN